MAGVWRLPSHRWDRGPDEHRCEYGPVCGYDELGRYRVTPNLEAARDSRRLRLRDGSGIIILDFIDMDTKEDDAVFLSALKRRYGVTRRTHVLGFQPGPCGNDTQKVRRTLGTHHRDCPYCEGTGAVLSESTVALRAQQILRVCRTNSAGLLIEVTLLLLGY